LSSDASAAGVLAWVWRRQRLIVELDGRDAHSTPAQIAADGRRQAGLERMDYSVIRFRRREVRFEPERVAAQAAQVRLQLA